MSEPCSETPIQEAISIITIGAILLGVGCYAAAVNNVPVISGGLFWVAVRVYSVFPWLDSLQSPQMPMLVAADSFPLRQTGKSVCRVFRVTSYSIWV
jgi:hypothetical protein